MEPLSAVASIIAVLQVTSTVISICYNYGSAAKSSAKELLQVTQELESLRYILENLKDFAQKAESGDPVAKIRIPTLKLLCESQTKPGPLANCLEELKRLEDKLSSPTWAGSDGSKRRALIQAMRWPLNERDTKQTLGNIERCKTTLALALDVDHAALTLATQDEVKETALKVQELHVSSASNQSNTRRRDIQFWLSAPDPSWNHKQAREKQHATTGTWFSGGKEFADWKANPHSFLWLHGIPGCGKTILSSTIIDDVTDLCHLNPVQAVAYFYFDYNDVEKRMQEKMFRSLLVQLSQQARGTLQALESLFSSSMDGMRQPTTNLLLTTLQEIVRDFGATFIVIDALDECIDRHELLKNLKRIATWGLGNLHILVTSRKEKDIADILDPLVTEAAKICIQSTQVNIDIRTYIRNRVNNDPGLRRWQKRSEEIETKLMEKADGMFRWVVCQLDSLENCLNLAALRKALVSLPGTLDETYDRMLSKIPTPHIKEATKLLQWLAYSTRPLSMEEIGEVIAIDIECHPRFDIDRRLEDPQDILTICPSLVTEAEEEQLYPRRRTRRIVKLAHYSVMEYLISGRTQPTWTFVMQEIHSHTSIAETCLAYLLQLDMKSSNWTNQTLDEFPLAYYAAKYWTGHVQKVEKVGRFLELTKEFYLHEDAFANWCRFFDAFVEPSWMYGLTSYDGRLQTPLYHASQACLLESLKFLLDKGVDLNAQGGKYGTALQAASKRGDVKMVKLLINKGADVNAQDGEYGNALQAASQQGHETILRLLLNNGANVNAQGGYYGTALQAALKEGHSNIVQLLFNNGAHVDAQGGYCGNALQAASCDGNGEMVRLLLGKGAEVNAQGGHYGTALQAASAKGHEAVVQLLLENGANIHAQGGRCGNALEAAAAHGRETIVRLLLRNGANINASDGIFGTALQAAAFIGHEKILRLLLDNGADITAGAGDYGNALNAASHFGQETAVRLLLNSGADVNAGSSKGTALQAASYAGRKTVVQLLLDRGAKINMPGGRNGHALIAACFSDHEAVVQLLLANGADVNLQDRYFGNALQVAAWRGSEPVIQLLLENGADVNAQGGEYGNALQAALLNDHDKVARLLLKNGAKKDD